MDTTLLYSEALGLPTEGRKELMDLLSESLDDAYQAEIERSHVEEVQDRVAAYKRGEMEAVEWSVAMADLKRRFA